MHYEITAVIYNDGTLDKRGEITLKTESNAPSEIDRAKRMLLESYPAYIHMYGHPRVPASEFRAHGLIGRVCGKYESIRYKADLSRNPNHLPIYVFIDVTKRVIND